MNFNKSNGGIWYAICFANYYDSLLPNEKSIDTVKWNARKYGYKNLKDRVVGFQVTWARDTLVDKHRRSILGNPNIQGMENWEIAGEGSALNFSQFLNDFDFYKTERLYPMKYEVDRLDSALSRNIYITFREAQRDVKNNELLKSNR